MRFFDSLLRLVIVAVCFCGVALGGNKPPALWVRVANFTVPPSTGPVGHVVLRNRYERDCEASLELELPAGWKWTLEKSDFVVPALETVLVPFTIDKAVDLDANRYAVNVVVNGKDGYIASRGQEIVCASAPYFKPKIDGNLDEWADSIPVTFFDKGKTVIRTYWSRKFFCVAVEVHEDKLAGYRKGAKAGTVDAVQFAISPRGAVTGTKPDEKAQRYELLIADCAGLFAKDKCFLLMTPEGEVGVSEEMRKLEGLEFADAQVVVKRKGGVTYYECAVPFSLMKNIRPDVGREICFSVLVHDADAGNIRDWGEFSGLWPGVDNKYAWSSWQGVKWEKGRPFDNKIEWGLCSSKH